MNRSARIFIAFMVIMLIPVSSWAACSNPTAELGEIMLDDNTEMFMGCGKNGWVVFNIATPMPPVDCSVNGQNVAHGATQTFYTALTADNCPSQNRHCTSGYLTGSDLYQYPTCSDTTPDLIGFASQTKILRSTLVESNIAQVNGISGSVATAITGGGATYRICSDAACASVITNWTSGASTVQNGQYIQLRLTSSANHNTESVASMSVGTINAIWSVRTEVNVMRDGSLIGLGGGSAPWLDGPLSAAYDGATTGTWFGRTGDATPSNNNGRGLTMTFNSPKAIKKVILYGYGQSHTANIEYWNGSSWVSVVANSGVKPEPQIYNFNAAGTITSTMWRWYISGWANASNYYGWEFEAFE